MTITWTRRFRFPGNNSEKAFASKNRFPGKQLLDYVPVCEICICKGFTQATPTNHFAYVKLRGHDSRGHAPDKSTCHPQLSGVVKSKRSDFGLIVDLLSANFHAAVKYIGNIFSAIGYSVHCRTNYRLGRIIPLNLAKSDSWLDWVSCSACRRKAKQNKLYVSCYVLKK